MLWLPPLLFAGLLEPVDLPAKLGSMAPRLSPAKDGFIVSWLEPDPQHEGAHRLVYSAVSSAIVFGKPEVVASNEKILANWADVPSVTQGTDGTWLAHWAERTSKELYAYDVVLATKSSGGWKVLGPAHTDGTQSEHGFVSVLARPKGGYDLAWLDGRSLGGPKKSMTLRSARVSAGVIREHREIDDRVCECCGTSMAQTDRGAVLVYRDRDADEIRDIRLVRLGPKGWDHSVTVHQDRWKVAGCPVNGPSVDAMKNDVVVAWFTGADKGAVRVAFSSNAGDSFSEPLTIDAGERDAPLGRVDVSLINEREAVVSWVAARVDQGFLYVRRIADGGRMGPAVELAPVDLSRASGFPRIQVQGHSVFAVWTRSGPSKQLQAGRVPLSQIALSKSSPVVRIEAQKSEYRATALDGSPVSLSALRGRVVVVNLWATWCAPCTRELPDLSQIYEKYRARGLAMIAISIDERANDQRVRRLVRELGLRFPIWRDPEDRASPHFSVTELPATILLDRTQKTKFRHTGDLGAARAELVRAIEANL